MAVPHAEAVRHHDDTEQKQRYVNQTRHNAQPLASPVGRHTPNGAIPESLGEKEQPQDT